MGFCGDKEISFCKTAVFRSLVNPVEFPLNWVRILLETCFSLGIYHDSSATHTLLLMEAGADIGTKTAAKRTPARELRKDLAPHFTQVPSVKTGRSLK